MASNIPPPSPMSLTGDWNTNWEIFKAEFEDYALVTGLKDKDTAIQAATLRSLMGGECRYIYRQNLSLTAAQQNDVNAIMAALDTYFKPARNEFLERRVCCKQEEGESIDTLLTRLREKAASYPLYASSLFATTLKASPGEGSEQPAADEAGSRVQGPHAQPAFEQIAIDVQPSTPASPQSLKKTGTHETTLLLLESARRHWDLYNHQRTQMFINILQDFQLCGHDTTVEKLKKKWNNLLVTYKRAKDRIRESGQTQITWVFFEAMDSLLSKAQGALPAKDTIMTTNLFPDASVPQCAPSTVSSQPLPSMSGLTVSTAIETPASLPQHIPEKRKAKTPGVNTAGEFLTEEADQSAKRTKMLETFIETNEWLQQKREESCRKAGQRDRRRERREIELLKEIKAVSAKQNKIIELLEIFLEKQ
ncbi:uncharacterized protein LOC136718890 [Amia ocellicauda]|uniref:uncharacterized protein LOC136718890 n=1 Tax=Amia ocellicauda TaxID=2972642 RepID=UPI0034638963